MNEQRNTANWIHRSFKRELEPLRFKARAGDVKAANKLMDGFAAMHFALKAVGYTTNDMGRLVKYQVPTNSPQMKCFDCNWFSWSWKRNKWLCDGCGKEAI